MNSKCISISFKPFIGVNAPVSSPFTSNELDISLIPPYANFLVNSGVNGVFVCGTNGESVSLTVSERKQILEAWMKTNEVKNGDLRVMIHIGHHCLPDMIELGKHAESLGVEAIAVMPPSFFRPLNEEQAGDFIAEIANYFPKTAFFYYHFPNMTNVRVNLCKTLILANKKANNIVGAKFSDIDLIDLTLSAQSGFNILTGNDGLFLQSLVSGGSGLIGAQCNFNAELPKKIWDCYQDKKINEAIQWQIKSTEFMNLVRSKGALGSVVKLCIKIFKNLDVGNVRLPIVGIKEEEKEKIGKELKEWITKNL